jgi:hypothetical protein
MSYFAVGLFFIVVIIVALTVMLSNASEKIAFAAMACYICLGTIPFVIMLIYEFRYDKSSLLVISHVCGLIGAVLIGIDFLNGIHRIVRNENLLNRSIFAFILTGAFLRFVYLKNRNRI